MDKKQFDLVGSMIREPAAATAEAKCNVLRVRLKQAAAEIKKQVNAKDVYEAAGKLLKQVEPAYSELKKICNMSQKDLLAMSVADYKKKSEKMIKLLASASDAAVVYCTTYKKSSDSDTKIGASAGANASNEAAKQLMQAATETKIRYNMIK